MKNKYFWWQFWKKKPTWWQKHRWEVFLLVILAGALIWFFNMDFGKNQPMEWGLNFSQKYAAWLNNGDWRTVYSDILKDLKPSRMRLVAYWDTIEKTQGQMDFTDLDWQIEQASRNQVKIILAIGYRVPRWPECHMPEWVQREDTPKQQKLTLNLLEKLVERYKNNSQIVGWQVENEPFFMQSFGLCPAVDKDFYRKEVAFVRSLDDRPVYGTESGELSTWRGTAGSVDYIGTSVYRVTWNKYFNYFTYPIPPAYYYLKTQIIKAFYPIKGIVVSEMQMEPWLPGTSVWDTPIEEQLKYMGLEQFQKNITYAQKIGLPPVYLWGAEWWYWLKQRNHPEIWEAARDLDL